MKSVLNFYSFVFCLLMIAGCQGQAQSVLSTKDFESKCTATQNAQLLDVRTPREFKEGHLDKAQNIDVLASDFDQKVAKLDKKQAVFVYCRSGGRSGRAAARLTKLGFQNIYDLEGGFLAWKKEGRKVVKD